MQFAQTGPPASVINLWAWTINVFPLLQVSAHSICANIKTDYIKKCQFLWKYPKSNRIKTITQPTNTMANAASIESQIFIDHILFMSFHTIVYKNSKQNIWQGDSLAVIGNRIFVSFSAIKLRKKRSQILLVCPRQLFAIFSIPSELYSKRTR